MKAGEKQKSEITSQILVKMGDSIKVVKRPSSSRDYERIGIGAKNLAG